jgi:biotin synthase-related radical SAM superfamily protein
MAGISFDAARAEVFEKIRQRSQFSSILHNLEVLKEARRISGKGYLYFIVTVQKQNIQELPAIVDTDDSTAVRHKNVHRLFVAVISSDDSTICFRLTRLELVAVDHRSHSLEFFGYRSL